MTARVRVGITTGDPSGIGPEIACKAAVDPRVVAVCDPVLYGPSSSEDCAAFVPGVVSADSGKTAYQTVELAVADALSGRIDAIATAPIHKEGLKLAGFDWPGHTESVSYTHLTLPTKA